MRRRRALLRGLGGRGPLSGVSRQPSAVRKIFYGCVWGTLADLDMVALVVTEGHGTEDPVLAGADATTPRDWG